VKDEIHSKKGDFTTASSIEDRSSNDDINVDMGEEDEGEEEGSNLVCCRNQEKFLGFKASDHFVCELC
jgi:hypothetical protein